MKTSLRTRGRVFLFLLPALLLTACNQPQNSGGTTTASPAGTPAKLNIGYVLHGQNDFTQVIKQGAEDAGKDLDVNVEVTGPSSFTATDAIGMFEGMVQKKKDGLAVVPMSGDVWVRPIKEATDTGVPVITANMISEGSSASTWVGQDEYQSGVILAQELRKLLAADGKKSGTVVCGICAPSDAVLKDRYKGFKKGMEGSGFTLTDAMDVGTENTANYSAWENLASAHKDMVAAAGLCSMDIPNLAKLKVRSNAKWLIGGYDLNKETLDAIKAGTCQVTLGQHPYLQGYLPVLALVKNLRDKQPIAKGWLQLPTEIITKANVDTVYGRETDPAAAKKWYADLISKQFADLPGAAKPMPGKH